MSREDPIKAEKDFTKVLDEELPQLEKSNYKEAVDKYLALEKQIRQSSDLASSKRILIKIVEKLSDNDDWEYLNDLIPILSKKHGQMKTSIQLFIQEITKKLEKLQVNDEKQLTTKMKVIETIRTVTDKKIFVEVERAVVSKELAEIYLNKFQNLDKAVEILCDLQVETYSMMKFDTKIEYILQQIELTLMKKDYDQAKILSRKIMIKTLKNFDRAEEFKATYLKFLIEISEYEHDYISLVRNSLSLIEIDLIKHHDQYKSYLVSIIYYIILSPFDNLQKDLIEKIKNNNVFVKNVDGKIFKLLEIFTTNELIHWSSIESLYKSEFDNTSIFKGEEENYKNLQKRIVEHNLRIINKYYNFIKLDRLSYLLQLNNEELEKCVSELVNSGMISAKINRPQGIIKFDKVGSKQNNESINSLLNDWCYDVDKLLEEVDQIGHLINKEEMMYGIKQSS